MRERTGPNFYRASFKTHRGKVPSEPPGSCNNSMTIAWMRTVLPSWGWTMRLGQTVRLSSQAR